MTKFLNFINSNKNKDFTMEIVNIDNYMYYIFGLFNYNIFNYGLNNKQILDRDYIEIVKPSSFSLVFKPNLYDIETFTNINEILINIDSIINYIKNLVNQINNKIYKKSTISYITLPQYEGICWFISMLNCLTYSDMNKNLLIKKLEKTPTINKKNKFNRFIYYIINNITKDYKSYNSYFIYSNCILLSKLKSEPIKIIKTLLYKEATKIDKTELYYLSILKTICNMIDDEYFNINKKIPSNIL